ncbi:DUF7487 domain-containing protein [Paenibacillus sp. QZ-Y1]|uniref:DUF7487 domain-containing protein n=1 Tax=Paenibacillus sp. QZ-Y1 TaxID=3414511 RepID=UPI003F798BD3
MTSETITIRWNSKTKKHFVDKGYIFTKYGDRLEVKVNDLMPSSNAHVFYRCDYCFEKGMENNLSAPFCKYKKRRSNYKKDACTRCAHLKNKDVCLVKYGVENYFQVEMFKEKSINTQLEKYGMLYSQTEERQNQIENTNIERYGFKSPMQNERIQQKTKITNLIRYGDENPMRNEDVRNNLKVSIMKKYGVEYISQTEHYKEKFRKTSLEKFGVEHPFQSEEVKEKIKNTNLIKYGFKSAMQNAEVRNKANQTLHKNGNVKTSSQQLALFEMLSNNNNYSVELNYPLSTLSLDVALFYKGVKIDVEYDGWYWHQNQQQDRKRDEVVKSMGWKVLRVIGGKKLPNTNDLTEAIDKLVDSDIKFTRIKVGEAS